MLSINTRLYPLGKDYLRLVKRSAGGPIHAVWRGREWKTSCRLDLSGTDFAQADAPLNCPDCLAQLRSQGWDV